jgi:hypothetical protein
MHTLNSSGEMVGATKRVAMRVRGRRLYLC